MVARSAPFLERADARDHLQVFALLDTAAEAGLHGTGDEMLKAAPKPRLLDASPSR
jgi:hypothetical protein